METQKPLSLRKLNAVRTKWLYLPSDINVSTKNLRFFLFHFLDQSNYTKYEIRGAQKIATISCTGTVGPHVLPTPLLILNLRRPEIRK